MSKAPGRGQTRYVCQSCGEAFLRWEGQCRACSAWNSLVETVVRAEPKPPRLAVGPGVGGAVATSRLGDVGSADGARLTIGIAELDGPAGSVGQVRGSALRLMELAKPNGIAVVLVGHVTKDGSIAGPKTLEHLVDAVLTLDGDRYAPIRLLRASKNRFGSTDEVGVFQMSDGGLSEVADPARAFLAEHDGPAPGSVVAPTLEGSRPLLVEVQGLVAPGPGGTPRRTTSGVDSNRVALLVAVLARRAGIGLASHDIYVNLAGGLTVDEPGLDLPLALALASSLRDRPIGPGTVAIGEVGLLGELRSVVGLERRLREAARLGFGRAIVPRLGRGAATPNVASIDVIAVGSLREAIEVALSDVTGSPRRMAAASARC